MYLWGEGGGDESYPCVRVIVVRVLDETEVVCPRRPDPECPRIQHGIIPLSNPFKRGKMSLSIGREF